MERPISSASAHFYFLCTVIFLSLPLFKAQTPSTDPTEVRALNSLFEQWDVKAVEGLWNISGEPCTGFAVNSTAFEDPINNPAITCDCSYDSGATCHITQLRVYALDKTGIIPEVLVDLKYLTLLNIDQNYFTGPLPAFIENLTALTKLSIAHNAFSGSIPKEIGNLRELRELSIGINNFNGTLPPEIGNLPKLERIYINSCGLGGEIPSTFANLTSMILLWASDSPFSGKIPNFIGNWTRLRELRFQGNSFEGPIPSSFSNLTSLESLRISDLYNVTSTLDFLKNSKNLTNLNLRNALISGPIPSEIGQLVKLQKLDLSFNNLTGQIPSFLFNMTSLNSLFLGNNSLSGTIPNQKSDVLQNIDFSYNYLSGTFPSWVSANLQLNLVANNFSFDSTNISIFPGLNCLQRNFPCHRDVPLYANFSIKCGGEEMTSANGIIFEAENSSLGAASIFISSGEKWAVSNVGLYDDRTNPSYIENTLAQVTNTQIPELYQKSRMSPSSLRYYGLGLQNGNYTVTLFFAETAFPDPSTLRWQSHGRRVFDIYVQGKLELKDFDISKAAGGVERAITRNFNASVSDSHLEIHLFWAGKGTCCTPVQGYYGPIISALSAVPSDFIPTVSGIPPGNRKEKSKTGLIVGVTVSAAVACLVLLLSILYLKRKTRNDDEEVLLAMGHIPNTFSYAELRTATEDFNLSNKLGEGGFGPVYKGTLSDGRQVAVKQLSVESNQGTTQFIAEIAAISAVQHRNLVKLYGCCVEGNRRLLVYEYLENKSLDKALFGRDRLHLDWPTRFKICLATAKGLAYLHEESRPRIVHRDVKASNILLDAELCPKISDFGLAKLYDDKKTHISTGIAGTIGYLAPEYAMRGHLTEKADVFSFGVLALEIISGRLNSDNSLSEEQVYLLEWAWNLHEKNQSLALVDENLTIFDEEEVVRVVRVALLCTQGSPIMRPPMSRVAGMLSGDIEVNIVASKPSYLTDWDFKDVTSGFSNQNTWTVGDGSNKKNSSRHQEDDTTIDLNTNIGGVEAMHSPINITEPRLSDLIGGGR